MANMSDQITTWAYHMACLLVEQSTQECYFLRPDRVADLDLAHCQGSQVSYETHVPRFLTRSYILESASFMNINRLVFKTLKAAKAAKYRPSLINNRNLLYYV